jgi:glycopeptide antibiotics resistance protein
MVGLADAHRIGRYRRDALAFGRGDFDPRAGCALAQQTCLDRPDRSARFGVYVLLLLDITLFPVRILDQQGEFFPSRLLSSVNLIPFNFDLSFIPQTVLRQIVQNVLLTVPFGFGVLWITRAKSPAVIWLSLAVGFTIEGMQLLISLLMGYPYRIADINDVILNALGVIIGGAVYRGMVRLLRLADRAGIR